MSANPTVLFYGTLASASKRDALRAAKDAQFDVLLAPSPDLDAIVLGEAEPLGIVRARLADELDDDVRDAFEAGKLEILSESEFFRRAKERVAKELGAELKESDLAPGGATPAAVAELVGVPVASVRRWRERGLLAPIDPAARLPLFSTRQVLVAKRLAFLLSTGLSEDFLEKRLFSFLETERAKREAEAKRGALIALFPLNPDAQTVPEVDIAQIVLDSTLSSDGREILRLTPSGPVDAQGARRFDFAASPTDGTLETPVAAPLSEEEKRFALAERIAEKFANATSPTARPAFLDLFPTDAPELSPAADSPSEPNAPKPEKTVVQLCQEAWTLEREGYWEEAERIYRAAAMKGGRDPAVQCRLGKVLALQGDHSAARERFYSALELDSDYVDARIALADSLAALGDLPAAQSAYQTSLKSRPNDPALRVELGKLDLKLGKKQEAELEFRRALDLTDDPNLAADLRALAAALANN